MNTRLLIDEVLAEVARFIAKLATYGGARTLVADLPDRFFLHLANALEAEGLSKKLVADMCGLALRSYQKRIQRLAECRSDAGRTLWEATFVYLHQRRTVTRSDLERRFANDDPQTLGSVLHDLVESGLVFRTGTGASTLFRAADERELALVTPQSEDADALVWLSIYRDGPLTLDQLAERHRVFERATIETLLENLLADGRITLTDDRYSSRALIMSPGEQKGTTAAIADHVHAVFTTLTQALLRDPADPRRAFTGGSTYSFEVPPGHPLEAEVHALLPRLRAELSDLRRRADDTPTSDNPRILVYCGVTDAPAQESHDATP